MMDNKRWVVQLLVLLLILPIDIHAQKEHFVFTTAWKAQAQFAGYYVAYERGFYREAGLEVEIQHPTLTSSALTRLKSQECDAAMFSLMSAMDFISQGFSLVNIFQDSMNSSNLLISRWDTDPLKMKGKKVAIFNADPNYLTFIMDRREGMHYSWVPFSSGINLFLSGAVDATMAVSYNEYYLLLQSGFKLTKESVYRFSEHDYNIQETGVYVKSDYYRQHRSACEKFAKASRQGWEWTAQHPKEALDIVMKYVRKYASPTNRLLQRLMLEECLRLQVNKDTGKREYRVREDMVQKASRMMTECGLIARPVSYKELMGL
jgi:NitT/TauT family transport system substrate-binding protein